MIAPGEKTHWHDSDYKASVFSITPLKFLLLLIKITNIESGTKLQLHELRHCNHCPCQEVDPDQPLQKPSTFPS